MFQLINRTTNEVAYIGTTPTECRNYGIKKHIIGVEKSKFFRHLLFGHWSIERVVSGDNLTAYRTWKNQK